MSELIFNIRQDVDDDEKPIQIGVFTCDLESEELSDEIMHGLESGELDADEAMEQLEQLLGEDPENLEVYNALSTLYWEDELKDMASEFYEKAYKLASALIPSGFKGQIPWLELGNRAFLRVAHGHLLCLMHEGKARSAQALANKLLRWSPEDYLGVRFLMGDIKFIQGDYTGAMKHYLKYADNQPVQWYQAALIAFKNEDFVSACTYLRRGIAWVPYVAEGILGRTQFVDHLYWHSTNLVTAEAAVEYLESWPRSWSEEEMDFVDWVFNHSSVLRERAEITAMRETLSQNGYISIREDIPGRFDAFLAGLDDSLSRELVKPIRNRWGEEILPWDRLGHAAPAAVRNGQVH